MMPMTRWWLRAGCGSRNLLDKVSDVTGGKRKEVRDIIDATLAELGAALSRGDHVSLPELGRMRVSRRAGNAAEGESLVIKLRRPGTDQKKKDGKETLAEGGDNS